MKRVSNIAITITTLILLVFGAGGIGISKCACSGKISVVTPLEKNCCPTESGCMSFLFAHLSPSEIPQNDKIAQPLPTIIPASLMVECPICRLIPTIVPTFSPVKPPTSFVKTIVLRV